MISFTHLAPDPEATEAIGRALAGVLLPGDVVALDGELGAGKTTFVRAVAAHLGVEPGLVSSPTFVMVNQYPVPQSANASPLRGGQVIHVDAYRLTGADDLETLGWDRLFDAGGQALGAALGGVMIAQGGMLRLHEVGFVVLLAAMAMSAWAAWLHTASGRAASQKRSWGSR